MKMKNIIITAIFLCASSFIIAQQSSRWSSFYETGFIWNPALTAKWNSWEVSATQQKEWGGFDDGPQNSSVGFQFPFIKNQTKVTVGAFASTNKVGPYNSVNFAGTYSYKMRTRWFDNYDDVFTLGILGSVEQHRFDETKLIAFDQISGDPNILGQSSRKITPNFSVGAFYNSVSDFYAFESHYYFGLAVGNLFPGSIIDLDLGQVERSLDIYAHGGYRYFPHGSKQYFEPSIFVSYSLTKVLNAVAQVRYEKVDRFWLSSGAVSNGEVFAQAGLIFADDSFLERVLNEGIFRVGLKGDYQLGKISRTLGAGYEIYLAYVYSLE